MEMGEKLMTVFCFLQYNCTWCVVGHTRDLRQVNRTNTCIWTVAQLQQEVMAVLIYPYTRRANIKTGSGVREEVKHKSETYTLDQ